jgi:hypothetical protein
MMNNLLTKIDCFLENDVRHTEKMHYNTKKNEKSLIGKTK